MRKQKYYAITGLGLSIFGLVLEITLIILQTNPSSSDAILTSTIMGLLFTGTIFLNVTYLEWKHQPNSRVTIILIIFSILGFILVYRFWNSLIAIWYPKSYIPLFVIIDFATIAFGGCLHLLLGRAWKSR